MPLVHGRGSHVREVEPATAVDSDVVRALQRLAVIRVGEHLELAGLQVRPGHARLALQFDAGALELRAFARDQPSLRIDQQTVGDVAVLAVGGEMSVRAELHDPLVDDVGEIDVAVAIDRWAFGEGDRRGDLGLLGGRGPRHQQEGEEERHREYVD